MYYKDILAGLKDSRSLPHRSQLHKVTHTSLFHLFLTYKHFKLSFYIVSCSSVLSTVLHSSVMPTVPHTNKSNAVVIAMSINQHMQFHIIYIVSYTHYMQIPLANAVHNATHSALYL